VRFGIQTGQQHRSYDDILSLWRLADRLGFRTAWLYDHLVPIGGDMNGNVFEAWTLLSSLLSRTEKIRGGILVTCVMYRHPSVLAKQAVTVDHASGGRLEFGIGSCWNGWEAGLYGIPFPALADRNTHLEDALEVIRGMWEGRDGTLGGDSYQVSAAHASPVPVQTPRPPIWVGGTGKRIPAIVAAHADGWNVVFTTFDEYAGHLARVRAACEQAGRDPAAVRLSFGQRVVVARTREAAEQRARDMYEAHGAPFDDFVRERVIFGAPDDVAAEVARFRDLGVEDFVLWHEPPMDDPDAGEQIEAFARDVAPLLS
jgi:alkanesulfonate monooxygenase SsuD/methylene tetrahydromethanopterin reductase-like flavin-dependent oxidoreductase (luciferase family)